VGREVHNRQAAAEVQEAPPVPESGDRKATKAWTKTDINFWLDALLAVLFVGLVWTSTVVYYAFPPGPQAEGWTLWGWSYQQWASLQFSTLCVMAGAVVLHVMLHWTWVYSVASGKFGRRRRGETPPARPDEGVRTLWGVALLIFALNLIGVGVAAAVLSIQGPSP